MLSANPFVQVSMPEMVEEASYVIMILIEWPSRQKPC